MSIEKKECGNCFWWDAPKSPRELYGTCRDALERARASIPVSVYMGQDSKSTPLASFCDDCPCWKAKDSLKCEKTDKADQTDKEKEQIKIGDRVCVEWENYLSPIYGTVKYTPCSDGDSWVIISDAIPVEGIAKKTYHIQKYSRISKNIE